MTSRTAPSYARAATRRHLGEARRPSGGDAADAARDEGPRATYSLRDALRVPSLVTLVRLPLAFLFVFVVEHPGWATAVIGSAGLSDLLDGWLARRRNEQTATGAVLDGVMDKVFVLCVGASLWVVGSITLLEVVLLGTRDLGELSLVAWLALRHQRVSAGEHRASAFGKLATVLQFMTVLALIWRVPYEHAWIVATALAGLLAAVTYWSREARSARGAPVHD